MGNFDPFSNVILTLGNTNAKGEVQKTRVLKGREAYSTYHLAYYVSEVIEKRKLQETARGIPLGDLPRLDRDLALYTLLVGDRPKLLGGSPGTTVIEFGGSLMELIDGLDVMGAHFGEGFASQSIDYVSIEDDATFNFVARALHPTHKIEFIDDYASWVRAPKVTVGPKILYDRAVSCYAIHNTPNLVAFIETFDICLMQLYNSMDGDFDYIGPEGSNFHYFDMDILRSHFGQRMIHLYGKRRPSMINDAFLNQRSVIEGYFLFAKSEALCSEVVRTLLTSHYSSPFYSGKVTASDCVDFARVQRIIATN
jgi:hypothetical protein